jgi:hypothetical protein
MKLELSLPKEEPLDDDKRKKHNASVFAVFPVLEKDINRLIFEQLEETYRDNVEMAKTREEVVLATVRGNGIIQGVGMLLDKWKADAQAHQADGKSPEKFDKFKVIGEVDE